MYKFLNQKGNSIVSEHGNQKWKIGEWVHVDGEMKCCENGLHASKTVYQAFSYVQGSVLAKVEVKGKHDDEDDKSAYSDMRIVKAYKWTKKDSVASSIYSAELCLKEFEKLYPGDDRPRKAIDAARAVLAHDTAKNRSAAWSAAESAAGSAWSAAESAAESAAWSAWSAAWSAADSAAESAWSAADSAGSAWSAARSAVIKKIDKFMVNRIKELEEL